MTVINRFRPCRVISDAFEDNSKTTQQLTDSIQDLTRTIEQYIEQTNSPRNTINDEEE